MPICPSQLPFVVMHNQHSSPMQFSPITPKFTLPKQKTLFIMNFFISFSPLYVKFDQKMLVMNFKNLIAQLCRNIIAHYLKRSLNNVWN
jgi:hypothetical protein